MSPKPSIKAPTSDVTPESALKTIEKTIVELGIFGGGQRRTTLMVTGQRLHKALAELQSAEAHAANLRAGMAGLVKEALDAISGTQPLSRTATNGANGAAPDATTVDAPTVQQ